MNSALKAQSHSLMNEFLCAFRHVRALILGPLSVITDRVWGLFIYFFKNFPLQHVVYPSHNKDFPLKVQAGSSLTDLKT